VKLQQIFRIIAERRRRVNAENESRFLREKEMGAVAISAAPISNQILRLSIPP
jgi:hypothetical protein